MTTASCADIADVKDDVDVSEVQTLLHNNILASRYVANMETFGFEPNERGRHQFHLKLICFWIDVFI